MSDNFLGEIRMFAGNFAPRGWALCSGQILPIQQNTALFALLGVTYGGNGSTTFALPNLQGRAPLQPRQGPGLSAYTLGQSGGEFEHTLLSSELPAHNHALNANTLNATSATAPGNLLARAGSRSARYYSPAASSPTPLGGATVTNAGGGLPHSNLQPYLVFSFIIALQGIFPPRP